MDLLTLADVVFAWGYGRAGIILAKVEENDQLIGIPPSTWRTRALIEQELAFYRDNAIELSNPVLQGFDDHATLESVVSSLNRRVVHGPVRFLKDPQTTRVLQFLVANKIINGFEDQVKTRPDEADIYIVYVKPADRVPAQQ